MDSKTLEYIIIGAYLLFIVAKGIKQSGKIKDKEDFLIAGRNTTWFLLFCTVSATIVGGGYSIGAIAKTYEFGLIWVAVSIGGYMQLVFAGKYVAPIFRKHNLYTIAAYFKMRFDRRSRFIAFLLSLLFSVGVLGAQLIAFGEIIHNMIPEIPYQMAVIIGATIVIVYSTIGGLFAVIHTDLYQFIILSVGFLVTSIMCLPDILASGGPVIPADFLNFNMDRSLIFIITTFIAFLMGETFAPGYITRFGAAKDIKTAKKGIIRSGIFLSLAFPVVIYIISLYARMFLPGIDPQQALPEVITRLHNSLIGGLIIAALMSAVMSSADSILNSLTALSLKISLKSTTSKGNLSKKRGLLLQEVRHLSWVYLE